MEMSRIMIVDGYNAIRRIGRFKEAELSGGISAGREALLMELDNFGGVSGIHVVAVFDGGGNPEGCSFAASFEHFSGVDVYYSRRGISADYEIISLARDIISKNSYRGAEIELEHLLVVSDDLMIKDEIRELGGFALSTDALDEAMKSGRVPSY